MKRQTLIKAIVILIKNNNPFLHYLERAIASSYHEVRNHHYQYNSKSVFEKKQYENKKKLHFFQSFYPVLIYIEKTI